ncbi:MAG: indole-3-glycerol phosphate synthase TrpC [Oscillospiraceae bacterium]
MTILDELAAQARRRTEKAKAKLSAETIRAMALGMERGDFSFEKALKKPSMAFICECKKASPSKGVIAEHFPYVEIAAEYEKAGADCISVLTEPTRFLGSDEYLREITAAVNIPCLRKDFTVDEYMIYEAKLMGAKAVLLICSILTEQQIADDIRICDDLGISALVEAHDEAEIKTAMHAGARIIGVNNRNLKDFSVDTENSRRLRSLVPADIIFVSESGVHSAEDIAKLREAGVDAVLIGEALMKAENKAKKLAELRGAYDEN